MTNPNKFKAWVHDRARGCMDDSEIKRELLGQLDRESNEYHFNNPATQAQWEAWQEATRSANANWKQTIHKAVKDAIANDEMHKSKRSWTRALNIRIERD